MGFEIFGMRVFDLSKKFGYFEVFSAIVIVCGMAFIGLLVLKMVAKTYKKTRA